MNFRLSVADLLTLPITEEAVIPASFLDDMGHMNVAWYMHLFSNASMSFFSQLGMTEEYRQQTATGSFALQAHVRYLREVYVGNEVVLRTRTLGRSDKRFHFIHFMARGDDVAATCEFVATHVDMRSRRSSATTEPIAAAFDRYLQQHRALAWPVAACGGMGP